MKAIAKKTTVMHMYRMLGIAISIATRAHRGQFDKGGKPYILHPLHLMFQLMYDIELAIIAVLHDVVEDSAWTIEGLIKMGFSKRVTDALYLLTHLDDETYEEYISRISTNYDAIRVKRKDLGHNSDITRLPYKCEKDHSKNLARIGKYQKAFIKLGKAKKRFQQKLSFKAITDQNDFRGEDHY